MNKYIDTDIEQSILLQTSAFNNLLAAIEDDSITVKSYDISSISGNVICEVLLTRYDNIEIEVKTNDYIIYRLPIINWFVLISKYGFIKKLYERL